MAVALLRGGSQQQGCDLRAVDEEAEPAAFARSLVQCLARKGFAAVAGAEPGDALAEARRELADLDAAGRFERVPAEIAQGLLGEEGSTRLLPLQGLTSSGEGPDSVARSPTRLQAISERMYSLGMSVGALAPFVLGFGVESRDHGYVFEAGAGAAVAPPRLTAEVCLRWLEVFDVHRLMCLCCLGPSGGVLEMQPFDGVSGSHKLSLEPGMWVVLRADVLSHVFVPSGTSYTLSCFFFQSQSAAEPRRKLRDFPPVPVAAQLDAWLLEEVRALKQAAANEEELAALVSRPVQRMLNHMYHKGAQVAVRGHACRFPGDSPNVDHFRCALFSGSDAAQSIPFARWDNEVFYAQESAETLIQTAGDVGFSHLRHRYNCEHGCFIEGLELFDNRFFGLSVLESRGMDPNQRHLLETCYEVVFSAGLRKPNLMRAHIGVYTGGPGTAETEWAKVPKESEGGALASTSGSSAILSNRLSYTFGMNGPNFLLNADGASSLIACSLASDALQMTKPQCDAAIILGIDAILHPMSYAQYCWAGLMSRRGRCLTFDESADGYIRGEGSGGLYLNSFVHQVDGEVVVDEEPRAIGLVCGTWATHSGQVASLSAPSCAADQEMIASALRVAEISPLDVDAVEAHGGATLLSDAVEAAAFCRALRARDKPAATAPDDVELLHAGCVKTNVGNGKPLAGMYGLVKVLLSQELGQLPPSCHLMRVNPHMALDDFPVNFTSEYVPQRMNSAFTGVTAKGFGGSCAHVVMWGAVDFDRVPLPRPVLEPQEIAYWPGGGGELDEEAKPSRSYAVVGSWSGWSKPEPMKAEGKGVFACTVSTGEAGFCSFQLWLDGDPTRVLHPGQAGSMQDVPVKGPNPVEDTLDSYWTVVGDAPDERYSVQLLVNGRYRVVTWKKVPPEEGAGAAGSS